MSSRKVIRRGFSGFNCRLRQVACVVLLSGLWPSAAQAGEVEVVNVAVDCREERLCDFDVTLAHDDEGWDHFANQWRVETPSGEMVGVRELLHPHVNEQPFTRRLSSVSIPDGVDIVRVCGSDSVHGSSPECLMIELPL